MKGINDDVFIAWLKFQRRAYSMKSYFDYSLFFIYSQIKNKDLKIIDYLIKTAKTIYTLMTKRPKILWIQLPPTPLLSISILYKKLFKECLIVADCHNALFSDKWIRYLNIKTINKVDIILVHNNVIKDIVLKMEIDKNKLFVLETKPAEKSHLRIQLNHSISHPCILMPCGFWEDEPLSVVFSAAHKIPDITIYITGPMERAKGVHDLTRTPNNVKILGY